MALPAQELTVDGFERQTASNVLGPVALTIRLLPLLLAAPGARVATMSSTAAWLGRIDLERLAVPRRYRPMPVYGATKLADLLLTAHLARVAEARGWDLRSTGAHPGFTRTELIANGPGARSSFAGFAERLVPSQEVDRGAEPLLVAATDPAAANGSYWGPAGLLEMTGEAGPARRPRAAKDVELAARFWRHAEELTGVALPAASGV